MFSFHLVFLQLINHDDDNYGIGKYLMFLWHSALLSTVLL